MSPDQAQLRQSLLLLSPTPSPPTYSSVKAAYRASVSAVLKELQTSSSGAGGEREILDIALPCRHLSHRTDASRATVYAETQRLLANVYKLITVISAAENVDVESEEGLDVRVIPIANREEGDHAGKPAAPVVSIRTLAASGRKWESIYVVESEDGERVLKAFLSEGDRSDADVRKVRGGEVTTAATAAGSAEQAPLPPSGDDTARRHYSIAVGGTFDHLHIGHKLLLTMFAFMADSSDDRERTLTVGITAGELLKNKKYADQLESWDARQRSVWRFLLAILDFGSGTSAAVASPEVVDEQGPNGRAVHYRLPTSGLVVKLVEIWDPFGPTITDESIDALVLSAETRAGGKAVNDKRSEKGWPVLDLFEVDVLDADEGEEEEKGREGKGDVAQGFQNKLSSTEIRRQQAEKTKGAASL